MTKGGKCFFMQDVQRESPRSDAFEQRPDRSGRVSEWALGGGGIGGADKAIQEVFLEEVTASAKTHGFPCSRERKEACVTGAK